MLLVVDIKNGNAGSPLSDDPSSIPGCGNDRYRGRRILSDEAEKEIAHFIRSNMINTSPRVPITNDRLRPLFHQALPLPPPHTTRSLPPPPSFSDGFILRFKRDHNFSRVTLPVRSRVTPLSPSEKKKSIRLENNYYQHIKRAIDEYGSDWVFNMDETPAHIAPTHIKTIHEKKKQKDEYVDAGGDVKAMTSTVVTVSASGKKLPLLFITKGTTDRSDEKYLGLVDEPHLVQHTDSGWMTTDMMVWYLNNIIKPHTNSRPCCLVVDHYGPHEDDEKVDVLAEELNIWLVFVPENRTYDLQPLDVGVNAVLKHKRNKIWMEHRINDPADDLGVGYGAKFIADAYKELSNDTIKKSFAKACQLNVDEL